MPIAVQPTSDKGDASMPIIFTRVAIFKEGESFVSLCPELNVSSYGDTLSEAKLAIKEAIEAVQTHPTVGEYSRNVQTQSFSPRAFIR